MASKQLSPGQLADLWVKAGGNPKSKYLAAAVAMAESGGYPNATNTNTNGTIDRGLWQINSIHGAQSSLDPMTNARAAVAISGDGANWRPWCTAWSDNACGTNGGSYLGAASRAVELYNDLGGNAIPGGIAGGITQGPPKTQPGTGLHVEGTPCRFHVDAKVTSLCLDKLVAGLAITGGGVVILAGVAVLLVATIEHTPAGRAATQALAVATPVGRALKAAPAARSQRRQAAARAAEGEAARREAAERQRAAEARREAAEARRRTDARRRARHANAAEKRRQEAHEQRMIHRARAANARPTGRSWTADELDARAARARAIASGKPPF